MVNTQNTHGHTALAMIVNLALLAAVSAGIVAAISTLFG
jgi:hypothetical protein